MSTPDVLVVVEDEDVVLVLGAQQGPAGPSSATLAIAGATMSGHRAVAWQADGEIELADNTTAAHRTATVGVITQAVAAGAEVAVTTSGRIAEPSWSWTPLGPIFLGAAGALTQTVPAFPSASFSRVIGHAITATSMWVDVQPPTQLA